MQFYELKVQNITRETPDTITIELAIPTELKDTFAYKQGQYITIRREADGHEIRRSYSMSSSPLETGHLAVTVKKVAGGRMSTWLHDSIQVGQTLDIAPPEGRFFATLHPEKRRTYYLIGSGSGITPLMSILRTTLEAEPMSTVFLLYGSRDESQIIFRDALDQLAERYTGQLFVEHVLSQPPKQGGGLFGMFKKTTALWAGKKGRITASIVNEYLDDNPPHGPEGDCGYFVCGPGNMIETVQTALLARGIAAGLIYTEHFTNAGQVPGEGIKADATNGTKLIVYLKGQRIETNVPAGATILDAMVRDKYDAPYSCTAGACSTCMAKVMQGQVKMDACYALDDDEVKAGYILTCQARPTTDLVEISYDM
jgi:ring-1,2-phenylacetyl-CoA epoxidase subunit PaaE